MTFLVTVLQFKKCKNYANLLPAHGSGSLSFHFIYLHRLRPVITAVCESEQAESGSQRDKPGSLPSASQHYHFCYLFCSKIMQVSGLFTVYNVRSK